MDQVPFIEFCAEAQVVHIPKTEVNFPPAYGGTHLFSSLQASTLGVQEP